MNNGQIPPAGSSNFQNLYGFSGFYQQPPVSAQQSQQFQQLQYPAPLTAPPRSPHQENLLNAAFQLMTATPQQSQPVATPSAANLADLRSRAAELLLAHVPLDERLRRAAQGNPQPVRASMQNQTHAPQGGFDANMHPNPTQPENADYAMQYLNILVQLNQNNRLRQLSTHDTVNLSAWVVYIDTQITHLNQRIAENPYDDNLRNYVVSLNEISGLAQAILQQRG